MRRPGGTRKNKEGQFKKVTQDRRTEKIPDPQSPLTIHAAGFSLPKFLFLSLIKKERESPQPAEGARESVNCLRNLNEWSLDIHDRPSILTRFSQQFVVMI